MLVTESHPKVDHATQSLFPVHFSINELGLCQSLALSIISSVLKSKIVLELGNISVVRDFPNIFSEVSPGCHLTIMLSS